MNGKEMRINMIKLFALGVKFANAKLAFDEWSYRDIISEIFDTNDEPATVEEIISRLDKIENINYIEECRKLCRTANKIRETNVMIELIKKRVEELEII